MGQDPQYGQGLLLNILQAQGFGFFYMTCITHEEIHLVGCIFVDDTDIVESHPEDQYPRATVAQMQGSLDTWDGGMEATLGAP
jgi:hypothetical protein